MNNISVPTPDQVTADTQTMYNIVQKRMGKVPNLYATIGYSPFALQAFMTFEDTLNKGVFSPKEREAIALIVSEINGCAYCLAGHTVAAIKHGFIKEETIAIRRGRVDDARLNAIIQLARAITETKGMPDDASLAAFYAAGLDNAALMELVGLVVVRIFTNYVFALTNVPIDFPGAEPLN